MATQAAKSSKNKKWYQGLFAQVLIAMVLGGRRLDPFGSVPCPECQPGRRSYQNVFALSKATALPLARKGAPNFPFRNFLVVHLVGRLDKGSR